LINHLWIITFISLACLIPRLFFTRTTFLFVQITSLLLWGSGLWCLTPLSTIFQLYRGGQRLERGENQNIWFEPLLRGHLSYEVTLLCPKVDVLIQVWLYQYSNTCMTIFCLFCRCKWFLKWSNDESIISFSFTITEWKFKFSTSPSHS